MLLRSPLFAALFICLQATSVHAQDSLSVKDTSEINYRAQLLISEYQDLLNIVSNSAVDAKQSRDVIYNSHAGSENKIFTDSSVQVEDDIDPAIHGSEGSKDLPVPKYLNNLDLFYHKSDTPSIEFSNLRLSPIKKGDYLYVKVYFNCLFKNRNGSSDSLYRPNNRVAEIRLEKKESKWTGNIIHIGFFDPSLLGADTINDFRSIYTVEKPKDLNGGSTDSAQGTAAARTPEEDLDEKERQKEIQAYKEKTARYNKLVELGDEYLKNNDFASATKSFADAQDLMPYELYPKLKINQIRKQAEQAAINADELFKQFIAKARIAEGSRKYEASKEFYENAIAQKPEERKNWDDHLKELDNKIRTMSVFEDKFNSGLYAEDIKDFDKVIKKDKTNSDYFLGRGKCYDKLDNYSKALADYSKSIDLDAGNLEALRLRADLYKRNNEPFKALEDYKIYLTIDKTDLQIYLERSALHQSTNNPKGALEDIDQAILVSPKTAMLYFRKGLLLQTVNEPKNAIDNFTTAIALDSANAQSYYYRGVSRLDIREIGSAAADFNIARSKNLDSIDLANIATFAETYFQKGEQGWGSSHFDSAIRNYDYAILINPSSGLYRFKKGEYYFLENDFEASILNYSDAIRRRGGYTEAYYKKALAYLHLQDYRNAILNFDSTLALNRADPLAEKYCGDAWFNLSQYKDAALHFENALKIISNSKNYKDPLILASIYNTLGKSYFELGNYTAAYEDFKNAIREHKDFAEAFYNRGHTSYKMGSLSDAADDLLKALAYEDHFEWNSLLGRVYEEKREYVQAVQYFTRTIAGDSAVTLPGTVYSRGNCYYLLKDFASAKKDYLLGLTRKLDTLKTFNYELGTVYLNLGIYDSAQVFYDKYYHADSSDAYGAYGIASALYLQNKVDEALTWFDKAFQSRTISYAVIKRDKQIEGIRNDKRFKELIRKYYK